jgi:hypothetical protein
MNICESLIGSSVKAIIGSLKTMLTKLFDSKLGTKTELMAELRRKRWSHTMLNLD